MKGREIDNLSWIQGHTHAITENDIVLFCLMTTGLVMVLEEKGLISGTH